MTLTFECINAARKRVFYVMGANKAGMVQKVLVGPLMPDELPSQAVGLADHKALWILDREAAALL
jgi:6-phosphogluconolactonase